MEMVLSSGRHQSKSHPKSHRSFLTLILMFCALMPLSGLLGCGDHDEVTAPNMPKSARRSLPPDGSGEFLLAPEYLDGLTDPVLEVRNVQDSSGHTLRFRRVVDPAVVEQLPSGEGAWILLSDDVEARDDETE